jgi:Rap1a immunity proteins
MNKAMIVAGALAGMLAATPAISQGRTGNTLYEACYEQPPVREACELYVAGVVDGWNQAAYFVIPEGEEPELSTATAAALAFGALAWCPPENNTLGQALDVVLKHLREYPESRNQKAAWITVKALGIAWPCEGE